MKLQLVMIVSLDDSPSEDVREYQTKVGGDINIHDSESEDSDYKDGSEVEEISNDDDSTNNNVSEIWANLEGSDDDDIMNKGNCEVEDETKYESDQQTEHERRGSDTTFSHNKDINEDDK